MFILIDEFLNIVELNREFDVSKIERILDQFFVAIDIFFLT